MQTYTLIHIVEKQSHKQRIEWLGVQNTYPDCRKTVKWMKSIPWLSKNSHMSEEQNYSWMCKIHILIVEKQLNEWRAYPDCRKTATCMNSRMTYGRAKHIPWLYKNSYMSEEQNDWMCKIHTLIVEKQLQKWTAYPDCRKTVTCMKRYPTFRKNSCTSEEHAWL